MRLLSWCMLATLVSSCLALHESDVGVLDWHKPNIGIPLTHRHNAAPVLHRVGQKNTKTVILTATESNVLAALDPLNGNITWRHLFQDGDNLHSFEKHDTVIAALSGSEATTLRLFDVLSGELLLEKRLPRSTHASPSTLSTSPLEFNADSSIIVLADPSTIHSVTPTGELAWTWTSPDQGSSILYTRIAATPEAIYVIGLSSSFMSYTLHVTALSPSTGTVLSDSAISSSLSSYDSGVVILSTPSVPPHLVWLDKGAYLKALPLTPSLDAKASTLEGSGAKVVELGLNKYGHIVLENASGSSRVVKLTEHGLEKVWDWEATQSTLYAGGLDKERKPYLAKYYWAPNYRMNSVELLAPHLGDGTGLVAGYSFRGDKASYGDVVHIAMDAASPSSMSVLGRLFLTTTTGTVQFMQQDKLQWTREESLSNLELVQFVELPENKLDSRRLEEERFLQRLERQLRDAQDLPAYLVKFAKRFATGSYASASSSATAQTGDATLTRDAFGFRQVIVTVSKRGKLFGLDSSNGNIIWSRRFPSGTPAKLFISELQAFVVVEDANDIVLYHFDALTGASLGQGERADRMLHGIKVGSGKLANAYLIDKAVLILDSSLQAHVYPKTEQARQVVQSALSAAHLPVVLGGSVAGYQLSNDSSFIATASWSLPFAPESKLIPATPGPIASLGKVLGNRTTLYKYLNPRLSILVSPYPQGCELRVLDGAKGSVVYDATLPTSTECADVQGTLEGHRLVYGYYDDEYLGTAQTKGYRIVVVEMYEGAGVDDKRKSSDLTPFSKDNLDITFYENSFVYRNEVTAMATTRTKFGISGKDVIVATNDNKIRSIPGRLLNPRRPNRKATSQEMEEQLIQYHPVLPSDAKLVLSHNYQVAKISKIITVPSLLESTSLIFASGLDLFLTRVAPSRTFDVLSEEFNKAQLVLTIVGLAVAIVVTRPMVSKKRLRDRWY